MTTIRITAGPLLYLRQNIFFQQLSLVIKTLTGTQHRVKEAIHIRLHPNNINRYSGIEIPEAWMPTIKKHNRRTVQQRTTEGATSGQDCEDRNAPTTADHCDINRAT